MQHKGRSLAGNKGVKDDLHRVAYLLGKKRVGLRVGGCRVDGRLSLDLQSRTLLTQVIKAQPRDDCRQPGGQFVNVVGAG